MAVRAKASAGAQSYQGENCKGRNGGQNRRKAVQSYQGENCKGRKGGHKRKKVPGAGAREGTGGTLWTHGLVDSVGGACAGGAHVHVPSAQVPWPLHQSGFVTQKSMSQRAPEWPVLHLGAAAASAPTEPDGWAVGR